MNESNWFKINGLYKKRLGGGELSLTHIKDIALEALMKLKYSPFLLRQN